MIRTTLVLLFVILFATPSFAQFSPAGTGGLERLDVSLRQLGHMKRVLLIGAHPDDEDTSLLSVLARGYGAQAAYLSLSRGEGGQNLIGTELGLELGVLRSEELLAARSRDGARQFFTRAFDFGYSKTLSETLAFWPRDTLIKDVVRIVRRFRPQIVVTTFSGTPRDGHGQHQSAGVAAREAFRLAGDSSVFPELLSEEGLRPHTPLKLYQSTRFNPTATTERLDAGALDPVLGRSFFQIAMDSRSQHRSQDMGRIQAAGPRTVLLALIDDRTGGGDVFLAGIDTTLAGQVQGGAAVHLERYSALVDSARYRLRPRAGQEMALLLQEALSHLRLAVGSMSGEHPMQTVLREQCVTLSGALANAAGVAVDATVSDPRLAPGQSARVVVEVWNTGLQPVRVQRVEVVGPFASETSIGQRIVAPGALERDTVEVVVENGAEPTRPYYTTKQREGFMYDWNGVSGVDRGEPFGAPPLSVTIELEIGGTPIVITREVVYRFGDQALGEIREPVQIVPVVSVALTPERLVWPLRTTESQTFHVTLTNGTPGPVDGEVWLELPEDWPKVSVVPFSLTAKDETLSLSFSVQLPGGLEAGAYEVRAFAALSGGRRASTSTYAVRYPHTRPRFLVREARVTVQAADIALPRLSRVGYIRGASDVVPEALRAIGLPIELIDESTLSNGDLTEFDVIVVGSRAYETSPVLREHNARLLEYGRAGGTIIVQYQQYQFVRGDYAPFPLSIKRPHDRVTDETAAPRLLHPTHPAFTTPNLIRAEDWNAWVQERGLYFANEWDDAYHPMIEFADPGEAPKRGGMLIAQLGEGVYVYTGISFFRELPAGVPGAYRLLVNLLGLRGRDVL